ncbi:uncharacterized protein LOC106879988 [Octopus bimaculoides]|nr:uncharacterized protein LOC106879988 [Octopus bimaculoides]|eukprot:XP_014785251.1 PREDICTED: uncharacterized threonine-rich GPI-anchored glycoprotein PJ4664.02-like [Octopus bimaculoides]
MLPENITTTTTRITSTSQIAAETEKSSSQIPQTTQTSTSTVESTTQFTDILTTETTPPLTSTTEQPTQSTRATDVPTSLPTTFLTSTVHTLPEPTIVSSSIIHSTTTAIPHTDQTSTEYTTKASTEKTLEITTPATAIELFTTPLTDTTTQITSTSQIHTETEKSSSQLSQTKQIHTSTVQSTTQPTTTTEQSTLFTQAKDGDKSIPLTPASSKFQTLPQMTILSSPIVHTTTTEKPHTYQTSTQYTSEASTERILEISTQASTPELLTESITDTTIQITSKSQIPTETDKSTSQLPQTTHIDTSTAETTTLYSDIITQRGVTPKIRTSASRSASSVPEHIFTLNTTHLSSTTNLASLLHSTLSPSIPIFNGSSFVHPTFLSTKTKFPDTVSTTTSSPFVSSLQTSSISTLRSLISKFHNFSTLSPPNATNMSESSTSSLFSTSHFVTNNETYISEETNSTFPTHSKSIAQNFSYSPTSHERTKPTILTVITTKRPDFSLKSTTNASNQSSTLTVLKTFHPSTSMKITNESELYITKQPTHGILLTNATETKDKSYTMITARTSAKAIKRLPVTKILNATDFDEKIYSTPSSLLQTKPNASSTMLVISRSIKQHLSTPIKTHSTGKTVLPSPSSSSSTNISMIIISRRTKPITSIIPPTITSTITSPMKGSIIFGFDLLSLGTRRASFIHKFINAFMPYSGYSHYSIISWSKRPLHVNFPLSKHDSDRRKPHIPDLADIVEKIRNDLSSTTAKEEHNLDNIPPVVVLFVDPIETKLTIPLINAVEQLKQSGARVFLLNIGINKWPKQGTLELLSSKPSHLHIVHAPSYRQLLNRALNTPYQFRLLSNQYKPIKFKKTNAPTS